MTVKSRMYSGSDLATAVFVSIVIAFSVGFSFIGMSLCIRFGVMQILSAYDKIVDKLKNSKSS